MAWLVGGSGQLVQEGSQDGEVIEAEGLWDALLGKGGVHSCQELSESWDWPALKPV